MLGSIDGALLAVVDILIGGETPDPSCYSFLSPTEHAIQSAIVVLLSLLALWKLLPRSELPPFRKSWTDNIAAAVFVGIESVVIAQRTYQRTLITIANLCHITVCTMYVWTCRH